MDSARHKSLTGMGNELILRNFETALAACPEKIRIRIPLMPGLNDADGNIAAMAAFLGRYGVDSVDVLPCHVFGRNKYDALGLQQPGVPEYGPEELRSVLQRFAGQGLKTEIV